MDRKVYMKVKVEMEVVALIPEGVKVSDFIESMDIEVSDSEGAVEVEDVQVSSAKYEITDSK